MTYREIDGAIVDITRRKCDECKARLESIPKENVTERKAVQLEYGMYSFCGNAGLLFNTFGDRSGTVMTRRRFFERAVVGKYPKIDEVYRKIESEEEKLCFIAAVQAELFIRDQWLGSQLKELAAAEASGDVKSAFELKIKIGAVKSMFGAWEAWRAENGIYPRLFEEVCV